MVAPAVWAWLALTRLGEALRSDRRRIAVGAAAGWVYAVVGGAFALASLEFHGLVSRSTSDAIGIAVVLAGTGLGAIHAHRWRP